MIITCLGKEVVNLLYLAEFYQSSLIQNSSVEICCQNQISLFSTKLLVFSYCPFSIVSIMGSIFVTITDVLKVVITQYMPYTHGLSWSKAASWSPEYGMLVHSPQPLAQRNNYEGNYKWNITFKWAKLYVLHVSTYNYLYTVCARLQTYRQQWAVMKYTCITQAWCTLTDFSNR